jgi:hypothetical protein
VIISAWPTTGLRFSIARTGTTFQRLRYRLTEAFDLTTTTVRANAGMLGVLAELEREIPREDVAPESDVPDWQWALVEEALADGDSNDDSIDFRDRFADLRSRLRQRRHSA